MKLLLSIVLLMPVIASAGMGTFKVKGKASYCVGGDKGGANLEEAFFTARVMADEEAQAICDHDYRGERVAVRVTEFKTDIDKSDCLAKVKAKYRCVQQPIEPIGEPAKGEQGPLPEQDQPAPQPQQDPKTEPAPAPVPPQQVPAPKPK